jgi:tetratricopeptide (TPR) repeat protein
MRILPKHHIKKMRSFFILHIVIASLSISCTTTNSIMNQAMQAEKHGQYLQAVDLYIQILRQDRFNQQARLRLEQNGQRVLNDYLSAFFKANSLQEQEIAMRHYKTAVAFYEKIRFYGISLQFPDHYHKEYEEAKETLLANLYEKGKAALASGNHRESQAIFARLNTISPGYGTVNTLIHNARLEPDYNLGLQAFQNKEYHKAHWYFKKVFDVDPTFRQTKFYIEESISKGKFVFSLLPFGLENDNHKLADKLYSSLLRNISNSRDPFIAVVDRSHLNRILEEQKLGLSGLVDESTAARAGMLVGAKGVIIANIISSEIIEGKRNEETKTGYQQRLVRSRHPMTGQPMQQMIYEPVQYKEVHQENMVRVSFEYRFMHAETGKIITSDIIHKEDQHLIAYAEFSGNKQNLYPGDQSGAIISPAEYHKLQRLLNTPKNQKSITQMIDDICTQIAQQAGNSIIQHARNKVIN